MLGSSRRGATPLRRRSRPQAREIGRLAWTRRAFVRAIRSPARRPSRNRGRLSRGGSHPALSVDRRWSYPSFHETRHVLKEREDASRSEERKESVIRRASSCDPNALACRVLMLRRNHGLNTLAFFTTCSYLRMAHGRRLRHRSTTK